MSISSLFKTSCTLRAIGVPLAIMFTTIFSLQVNSQELTLDDTCMVSVLNRTVQASTNGSWRLDNIPTFMGQVRARATCVRAGLTVSGQTDYFTIPINGFTDFGKFEEIESEVIPERLEFLSGNNVILYGNDTYFRLRVIAHYADGTQQDVTRRNKGINYSISNPATASIDDNGVLQGLNSGRILITARKDGVSAIVSITIVTTGDQDNDGLPDDFERANGLNAHDPVDAFEDADNDGLSALDEYLAGTLINNADTDNDGISDGEELSLGADGFVTNPLLADSDSDGISDSLELAVGSDPTDINSYDLATSIQGVVIDPNSLVLTFNTVENKDVSAQLTVQGQTIDGGQVDLTSRSKGTNYSSSDLTVCNFGGRDGEIFAGQTGACLITAMNAGHSADADVDVRSFSPMALGYVAIDDKALNVDIAGDLAYVATGNGLRVINISNREMPYEIASLLLGTQINDIKVRGNYAYLAANGAGLLTIDISVPTEPKFVGRMDIKGDALDIQLYRSFIFIAAGDKGLIVADISLPTEPRFITQVTSQGYAQGISVSQNGEIAVLALGADGVEIFNTELVNAPKSLAYMSTLSPAQLFGANVKDVELEKGFAYLADYNLGLVVIDITEPNQPNLVGQTNIINVRNNNDIAVVGGFTVLADSFINTSGAAIVETRDPTNPTAKSILGVSGAGVANGLAVDSEYVYIASSTAFSIGQYLEFVDENTLAPTTSVLTPLNGDQVLEGGVVIASAEAQDDIGIAKLEFYVNGSLVATDFVSPFEALIPMPTAVPQAEITVRAYDYAGLFADSDIVTVNLIADSDVDGISDIDEQTLYGTSAYLSDSDNDGLQDRFEINAGFDPLDDDMDDDGLLDGEEFNLGEDGFVTEVNNPDSDNDGMPDGFESSYGFNPNDSTDAALDFDGDGVSNLDEFLAGSNPISADSDADGMPDDYERLYGLNPFDASDAYADLDNDGVPNIVEYNEQTDPSNPDVLPPEVALVAPFNGDLVPISTILVIRFSEPLLPSSLNATSVKLLDESAVEYDGVVALSQDGYIVTFNPTLYLPPNASYTLQLSGVRDLAGNPLSQQYNLSVNTSDVADTVGPTYLSSIPFNNDTAIPVNSQLSILFNELIDPTAINSDDFYLYDVPLGKKVPGTIGVTPDGQALYFIPEQPLLAGRRYYLNSKQVHDLSENICSNCSSYLRLYFTTDYKEDLVAPQLVTSAVTDGMTDVPLNASFKFIYDETLSGRSIQQLSLAKLNGSLIQSVQSLESDGKTLKIDPVINLAPETEYQITLNYIKDLAGNSINETKTIHFFTGLTADTSTGTITKWQVANNETNVPTNVHLKVEFSERIAPTSINSTTVRLFNYVTNKDVAGETVISADGRSVTFIPDELLIGGDTRYHFAIGYSPYIKDLAGNNVGINSSSYFYTGNQASDVAPRLSAQNIIDGATEIAVNSRLTMIFDNKISSLSLQNGTIEVSDGVRVFTGSLSLVNGTDVHFTPDEHLAAGTTYTVTVRGLYDYAEQVIAPLSYSFTTSITGEVDVTAPTATVTNISYGQTAVPVATVIEVEFSEVVDETTLKNIDIAGYGAIENISGDWVLAANGTTATFTPASNLPTNMSIKLYIRDYYDLAGNLGSYLYSVFYTVDALDTTPPEVIMVTPNDGSMDIVNTSKIELSFSKALNSSTINNNNFVFWTNGKLIKPTVSYSPDNLRVTLQSGSLPKGVPVAVVVTDGVTDIAGNSLGNFTSMFTTAVIDTDSTRPTIVSLYPNGSGVLPLHAEKITLFASEKINSALVAEAVNVVQNGVVVDGTVNVIGGSVIEFTPAAAFVAGAYIQIAIDSTAQDDSGNAFTSYQGSFTVASEKVAQRPTVQAYYPRYNATGVALNTQITFRYNEAIDPLSMTSENIYLKNTATNDIVSSTLALSQDGRIITIQPDAHLADNVRYQAVSTGGVTDTDGDTQYYQTTIYFTTDVDGLIDDRAPQVTAMNPVDGSENVPLNARVYLEFDEAINPINFTAAMSASVTIDSDSKGLNYQPDGVTLPANTTLTLAAPELGDGSGNVLIAHSINVTTGDSIDLIKPSVSVSTPKSGTTDVALNTVFTAYVNEPINPIYAKTSYLYDNSINAYVAVDVEVSANRQVIYVIPQSTLLPGRSYKVRFKLQDLAGNSTYLDNYITTGFDIDVVGPQVIATSVSNGLIDVPTNPRLTVKFNEVIDKVHFTEHATVKLLDSVGSVVASNTSIETSGAAISLVPKALLESNQVYTFVMSGVADRAGNIQAQATSVEFTTGSKVDGVTGAITKWQVANNETNVPTNVHLKVEFSERIAPTSINSTTVRLFNYVTNKDVAGETVISADGRSVTFIPDELLTGGDTRYHFRIGYSPYIKDLAGNHVGINSSSYFYTGDQASDVAPSLAAQNIVDGATEIAVNSRLKMIFDNKLSSFSLQKGTVVVSDGMSVFTGSLRLVNGTDVHFTPDEYLAANTTYTVTVSGLYNYAEQVIAPFTYSFTTSITGEVDVIAPSATVTNISYSQTAVPVDTTIEVEFSEVVDETSLEYIDIDASGIVNGTWLLSLSGTSATFTPTLLLPNNQFIRVYLRDYDDIAGNRATGVYHQFYTEI